MFRFVALCLVGASLAQAASVRSLTPRDECGAVLTGNEGTFTSPDYPDLYPANVSCEYVIAATNPDRGVRLTFADLATEADYDYVEVRDGDNADAPLLKRLTGEPDVSTIAITSTGPNIYLVLKSDQSVRSRGFSAAFASVCPNLLTADKGGLASPNFPAPYDPDLNLCWGISVAPGSAIELDVTSFKTGQEDVLTIYDGASEDSGVLAALSGSASGVYYSSSNNMFLTFVSNAAHGDEGFVAYYKAVCGNRFVGAAGTITSPNHPEDYPANANTCYLIAAAPGKTIQVTFTEFITEPNFDILTIYDGATADAPLLATVSGGATGTTVASTGDSLYMVFTSDSGVSGPGFVGEYVEV